MSKKTSRWIVQASEETCDLLAEEMKSCPQVVGTFTDSGFWYSNGETGPEWFTVTVEANYYDKEKVEAFLEEICKLKGLKTGNAYWG